MKDRKYTDVHAKFPPIPRFEIWLFTVWDQRAKAHSGPELVTVSLGWADRNFLSLSLTNKDDFMGQDAEEREPEKRKSNILNAIYFYFLLTKILILRVIFVNDKSTAVSKAKQIFQEPYHINVS